MSDFRVKLLSRYQMIGIEIDIFEDEASELISSDAFVVLTSKIYEDRLIANLVYLHRPNGRCYEMEQLKLCECEYRFAIGIHNSGEAVHYLWRFWVQDNRFVSKY